MSGGRSTFLELCNLTASFTGDLGKQDRGSLEEFNDGEARNLPRYVSTAWDELCGSRADWKFLREDGFLTNVLRAGETVQYVNHLLDCKLFEDGVATERVAKDEFSHWYDGGVFRAVDVDTDAEYFCRLWDYEKLRREYWHGDASGVPLFIAIMPSQDLYVQGAPLEGCPVRLRADFYRSPKALHVAGDMIDLPRHHEMAVVHRALALYYKSVGDNNRYNESLREYNGARSNLIRKWAPKLRAGG